MFRRILLLVCAAAFLGSVAAHAAAAPKKRTGKRATVDGTAAVIDSAVILQSEVTDQALIMAQQNNVDLRDTAAAREFKKRVLDSMVRKKLIASEAHRQGITATPAEVDAQVDQMLTSAKRTLGSDAAFLEQLRKENLTEEGLRRKYSDDVREDLAVRRLVQREVQGKVSADTNDARAFFLKHKTELPPRPDMYRLSVILVEVHAGDSVKARAREKATTVLTRLRAGEDFGKLATLFSDDPSAREEGKLPWFTPGTFDTTFEKAARALKPGQVSEVVETRFGFHVIRVDSVQGEKTLARHILVLVQPDTADSVRALEKARAVRARAFAREDFGKLAQQFSDDPDSRSRGGSLEPRELSAFSPDIGGVVSKLLPMQVSDVVRSPSGWVIFRLDEKQPSRPYEYAEVTEQLLQAARDEKFNAALDTWVGELKKKHRVTVHGVR
ncbi:MAG: peptidylprolyl isomerase [Candidatus Eisenbacteria bacterium]|nr:peptidylprolyl isomerase [Candidatus Eisenbacteria bacterium]